MRVRYLQRARGDIAFARDSFDIALSSPVFHYVASFGQMAQKAVQCLVGGDFEHPVVTAYGSQDWCDDACGNVVHFPADPYSIQGRASIAGR